MYVVNEKISVHNIPVQVLWSKLYNERDFLLIMLALVIMDISGAMKFVKAKEFVMF